MQCSSLGGWRRASAVLASMLFIGASFAPGGAAAANLAPKISGTPATWVYVGSQYSFRPTASDPEGKALQFTIVNKPGWATFSSSTGRLYGTPKSTGYWPGIQIRASDGVNTASLAFSIRATSRNNVAPVISGAPPTTATVGSAYSFQPTATDANADPLRFSISNRPSWATFSTTTGRLSGAPSSSHVGVYSSIVISASDGAKRVYLPAFSITVKGATTNKAPVISGAPATSINAGSTYSFRPGASDANGDALTFSITNKPSWATFSASTGRLSGTPSAAHVGAYSNIVIKVSDGKASAALAPFSITVTQVANGTATLTFIAPTANTDGSPLTNLAGFRILYGPSVSTLTQSIQIANPGVTTYVIDNLPPGTYYFAVKAYTSSGAESESSNVGFKVVQ